MRITQSWQIAPRDKLLLAAVLVFVLIAAAAFVLLSQPWLGIAFSAKEQGVSVHAVDAASPNAGRVTPGSVLVALEDAAGKRIALNPGLLIEVPDLLSFPEFNDFLDQQDEVHHLLDQEAVIAITADGQRVRLQTASAPLDILLWRFASHALYGLVGVLVAVGIWVFRSDSRAAQIYLASGVGVLLTTLPMAVFESRELALDGGLFSFLSLVNHLGTLLVTAALVAFFWVYPRPLGRAPVPALLLLAALGCWVLNLLQIGRGANDTVYLPVVIGYVCGLAFAAAQWHASRNRPLDRAALKWCVMAIFMGSVLLMVLIMIPPVLGEQPMVPLVVGFAAFLILYLGLAAGLLRYRLFDIERWWFRTWIWFAGGLTIIVLDMALIFGAGLAGEYALVLSLAIAGWVYFPLRQWLWGHLGRRADIALDSALREWVDQLFSADGEGEIIKAWPALLRRSFSPLNMWQQNARIERPRVSSDGTRIHLPALPDLREELCLEYPDNGGRLFSPVDKRVAALVYDLTSKALAAVRARESGAEAERSRIMRDLHDDLGARLLSLVYAAETPANRELARAGLKDLHDLIDTTAGVPVALPELISTNEAEVRARLNDADIRLRWQPPDPLPDVQFSARAGANVARILREALSNIIRHAGAKNVAVVWQFPRPDELSVTVSDDGLCPDPEGWSAGSGLRTMQVRAEDMAGRIQWRRNGAGGCDLIFSLPI